MTNREKMAEKPNKIISFEDLSNTRKLRLALIDMLGQVQGKRILDARRRRTAQLISLGFAITLVILILDVFGTLKYFENALYDQRCKYFQYTTPLPSEAIVHLDIDDNVLQAMNRRWPWPRKLQAKVVTELTRADPKVIFLDITYQEADKDDPSQDAALAAAFAKSGRVLAPVTLNLELKVPASELRKTVVTRLMQPGHLGDPEDQVLAYIGGLEKNRLSADKFQTLFVRARDEAVRANVLPTLQRNQAATLQQVCEDLNVNPKSTGILQRVIENQYTLLVRDRNIDRFTLALPGGTSDVIVPNSVDAPLVELSSAAACSGFVDFIPSYAGDAKVRFVPLWVNLNGRGLPHVSLAMACAYYGIPLTAIKFEPGRLVIPATATSKETAIPIRTLRRNDNQNVAYVVDIPWFGGDRWETMYDVPKHESVKQHYSLTLVTNILDADQNIRDNVNELTKYYVGLINEAGSEDDKLSIPTLQGMFADDEAFTDARIQDFFLSADETWEHVILPMREAIAAKPKRADGDGKKIELIDAVDGVRKKLVSNTRDLVQQRADLRADLHRKMGGKIILVGSVATGFVDQYPTPLHTTAPGVVAHGAIVNGILTDHFWGRAPSIYTHLLTLTLGFITTLLVASSTPAKAMAGASLTIVAYAIFNGYILFDRNHVVVGIAGPMFAMGLAWTGVTVFRYIAEIRERNRIQKRFSSYVDPELVNYIAAHPDEDTFGGREREMTVVFTDLEGFTTLSEKLKAGAVTILNEYVEKMAPIIRRHKGFLDKFLGDGIMFEFNTVQPNENHATDAVTAVLEMQVAMGGVNESLKARDLPPLRMRVGVNTGLMIVGDAGAMKGEVRASNFTVLGDPVNLAARLESANKAFGSLILVTKDTLDQTGGRFAVRPMARVRVKGKLEAVMAFEPLCLVTELDDVKKKLIALTTDVFDRFVAADFEGCMHACDRMDRELGESKFTKRYHHDSAILLAEGAGPDFDGTVTLSEK